METTRWMPERVRAGVIRPILARRGLALLLVAATAACDVSQEEEVAIGRSNAAQLDAQLPLVTDPAVDRYVDALGNAIAGPADDRGLAWRFRVVNSEQINAFALPGGFIYVNRGLIERAQNASQLAGVLGHEIAHVTLRHSAEQMEKARKTNVGLTVLCTLTNLCSSNVAQVAINVGGNVYFARHSREDESEADSAAVRNVVRAGIHPAGVPRFFEVMMAERARRPTAVEGWFGTHPLEEQRVEATRRLVAGLDPALLEGLTVDTPEFQALKRRLAMLPAAPQQSAP